LHPKASIIAVAAHASRSMSYEGRNAHKGSVMRTLFRRTECNRIVVIVLLLLGGAVFASAQEQRPKPQRTTAPPDVPVASQQLTSELTKDNLDRVAASAAQLKAVLVRDTGLIVELKRWMAKEASDNGQVVADEDLTDAAVYERLTNDVKFRSIATRLVQKYGYLRPSINPESDMAKEQDLVLKERAKRMVQIEAQEDQAALQPQTTGQRSQRTEPCRTGRYDENNPNDSECNDFENAPSREDRINPGATYPRNDRQFPTPDQGLPLNPNAQVLRAQLSGSEMTPGGLGENSSSYDALSNLLMTSGTKNGPDSLVAGNVTTEQLDLAAMYSNRANNLQGLGLPNSDPTQDLTARNSNRSDRPDLSNSTGSYSAARAPRNRLIVTPPETVHRPTPYADIPSLYDLYVQAPSRNGTPQRFGAQVFRDGLRDLRSVPMDLPVGPDYVVGPGDGLTIDLWGGVSTRLMRVVDRQGRVALPEAGPVEVSGRTLGDVQQLVQRTLGTQYRDASAEVSVSRLRTVRVYVVGEVSEPGAYDISSLSTPLNALVSAGGVTPRGSLRSLKHYRGRQLIEEVDAYDLLLRGVTPDARKLENGDTLMVSSLGSQVTVTGMVRRPAIYELHEEKTLADVLDLAGGILPAATLKHVEVQRLDAHEKRTMLSLDLSADGGGDAKLTAFKIRDGDEIHIFPIAPYNQDTIYLQGHVLRPGKYSYHEGIKLTDIVTSYKDLLPEPAAHYGEIIRLSPPDFRPNVVSFDLAAALKDPTSAPSLEPLDTVRVFSRFDFEPIPTVSVAGEVRLPGTYRTSGQASLRDAVFLAGGLTPNASVETAQLFRINPDGTSKIFSVNLREALNGTSADNILLQPRDRLLIHRNALSVDASTVEITGDVAKPGRYPYTGNMRAEDLIRAAGGLKRSADTSSADLTRYAAAGGPAQQLQISLASILNGSPTEDVPLRGGDVLAIRQVPGWKDIGAAIKVSGEVMHPSTYGIQPGERLSSVLERAGGYTKHAYPYGALLVRRDVREIELKSQMDLIARIKSEKALLTSLPENDADQKNAKLTAISQSEATLAELATHDPVGRVVVHIQGDINKWKNTPVDIALHDGDVLTIPKNPNTVLVTGQVFNPTAISQHGGRSAKWYLSQAGGLTPMADRKAVFVIRADGSVISAKNNNSGWWSGDPLSASLRPGDTVVVPERAPKVGGPNFTTVMQVAQLATSVALAVAYIHP
jgi:protein involved in polysaccharide export with SLBB domain